MKVTVNENNVLEFPCLLKSNDDFTLIILAYGFDGDNYVGTILVDSDSEQIGYYAEDWAVENFEPYDGIVTLSND